MSDLPKHFQARQGTPAIRGKGLAFAGAWIACVGAILIAGQSVALAESYATVMYGFCSTPAMMLETNIEQFVSVALTFSLLNWFLSRGNPRAVSIACIALLSALLIWLTSVRMVRYYTHS